MATHPAKVDSHLALAKADLRQMIEDAYKRGDAAGALAWAHGLKLIEEAHQVLADARQLQNWSRAPSSSLSQMATHDANCPKIFDHIKACNCVLASNYDKHCRAFMVPGRPSWDSYQPMPANALPCVLPPDHGGPHHTTPQAATVGEAVNHPSHYGGDTVYEVIKVIKAWKLDFSLGNAVKYIARAGKKDPTKTIEDLRKAIFYINDEIAWLEKTR